MTRTWCESLFAHGMLDIHLIIPRYIHGIHMNITAGQPVEGHTQTDIELLPQRCVHHQMLLGLRGEEDSELGEEKDTNQHPGEHRHIGTTRGLDLYLVPPNKGEERRYITSTIKLEKVEVMLPFLLFVPSFPVVYAQSFRSYYYQAHYYCKA